MSDAPRRPPSRKTRFPDPGDTKVPQGTSVVPGILPPAIPHAQRLRLALAKIDGDPTCPSGARSVLSSYFRFLNPSQTTEHLPRSLKPHHLNPERAKDDGSKWDILCHLLGNAAKALQTAYALDREYARIPDTRLDEKLAAKAKVEEAIKTLEARTARLEVLAAWGHKKWLIVGSYPVGFTLETEEEAQKALKDAVAGIATLLQAQVEA